MKYFCFGLILVITQSSFGQFNAFQITLEIGRSLKKPNYTRIDLNQINDSTAIAEIRTKPFPDSAWVIRPEANISYSMSILQFNKLGAMVKGLSTEQLLVGMNPSNPILGTDGSVESLELVVPMDRISFSFWSQTSETKERNLEPFLAICKEILLLAKLKPKDYL
ncbi:MAG: hypothetical protein NTV01_12230 [Bacteroidia bacterium]|nr:hypothetical protein [Bacteroidia bacterium]